MELSNSLPDVMIEKINEISKNIYLENLDPELKKRLDEENGRIEFDWKGNTFLVKNASDELTAAIYEDLKSKR